MPTILGDYVRAATARKPGLRPGATIPRLTGDLPPAAPAPRRLAKIRRELGLPADGLMPFLYPHVAGFATHIRLMTDRRFPLPIMGTVHIRSDITLYRPVRDDEVLRVVCAIDGHRAVEKGLEFDFETEVFVGAEKVWRGVATMLARQRGLGSSEKRRDPLPAASSGAVTVIEASAAAARRWAALSNDWNPIHLSRFTARLLGFKGQIMHGMWTLGRVTALQYLRLARAGAPVRVHCEFKLPIFPPARVLVRTAAEGSAVAFQVLDAKGEKPHLLGEIS